ncbi:unnamed protein product, partial [Staurois parvus]
VINAGKSQHNEDQACCEFVTVEERDSRLNSKCNESENSDVPTDTKISNGLSFYYWGLFDGHAGYGCSLTASRLLHLHICDQLRDLVHILQQPTIAAPLCLGSGTRNESASNTPTQEKTEPPLETALRFHLEKQVFPESLVIGALENAFRHMDEHIERERTSNSIDGGCCALVAICLLDKLYVANAGDSRAIIIQQGKTIPMSQEFTPETERQRLQFLASLKPDLLGNEFTCLEFPRRIQQKEIRKRMLYRDHTMTGWAYKTIEEDDMSFLLCMEKAKRLGLWPLLE